MKRWSSSLGQELTNNDDEFHPTSYPKMARRSSPRSQYNYEEETNQRVGNKTSSWTPRSSIILGSFSNPRTYVIHFLDSHLTFLQSFQICSLFGGVRIHGYHLHPLTYYSIYNYRINKPLSLEYIPSIIKSLPDIKSFIPDVQLAESALLNIQQKGGDILLIRKEATNESLFLKTIREHRIFKNWFSEKYILFANDRWRELEKDLHIRLIETTDQTVIIPREQVIQTVDHIINRWFNETTQDYPFVVLICGEKDTGKSTFTRYLINRALNHINPTYDLTYFDCDIGQCEFTIGGCLSYLNLDTPLLGPPCAHMKFNSKLSRLLYYGLVSPQTSPIRYLQYIDHLRRLWNSDQKKNPKRSMVLINTMGWGTGLGLELLKETICMSCPNVIIQLGDNSNLPQNRNQMPDVTLQWLMQQPVFTPYRRQIQMNDRRQADYDGQLNYEYIKIQSAAPSSTTTHSDTPQLRGRDHRLLATWSYFFFSNLLRLRFPWSQFVYVSLLDNTTNRLSDGLEHSIVAFCFSENINRLRQSAIDIDGIYHSTDHQQEIFECLGFGWIERCDKETRTYEIYTPVDCLSNTNILVTGAFDTPDEFEYMFKRVFVE